MQDPASPGPRSPSWPAGTLARLQAFDGSIWLVVLLGFVAALVAAFVSGEYANGIDAANLLFAVGTTAVLAGFTFGHLACAHGLRKGHPYGEKLLRLFSWIGLLRFPFGSISSLLTLRALGTAPSPGPSPSKPGRPIALFWILWQFEIVLVFLFLSGAASFGTASRARAKRTMSEMRTVATAVESYSVDFNLYPKAESMEELSRLLSPVYIRQLPVRDAWNHPFLYRVSADQKSYVITSPGKDGKYEMTDPWAYGEAVSTDASADIVFRDGKFVRWYGTSP